jgi:hypothetical protein
MIDKTLEELGIKYWDLNHSTLELESEYTKKLSSIKAEMKVIEKEFKKIRNVSQTSVSIGDYAVKSYEKRQEQGKE